jgi:Chaperone for flagella basal body P-ring formation
MLMAVALSAGAPPGIVRDWGLHRQWHVECDRAHPERPAHLVEIPWGGAGTLPAQSEARPPIARPRPPAVRAGMQVTVVRRGAMAEIRLRGTALGTARVGTTVAVRAGLGNAVVRGTVRGPGVVELTSEKAR